MALLGQFFVKQSEQNGYYTEYILVVKEWHYFSCLLKKNKKMGHVKVIL